MKLLRCCFLLLLTIGFASCWPNGNAVSDTLHNTPTKADTVLPAHEHTDANSASIKSDNADVPIMLKR